MIRRPPTSAPFPYTTLFGSSATSGTVIDQTPSLTVSIAGTAQEGQVLTAMPVANGNAHARTHASRSNRTPPSASATKTVARGHQAGQIHPHGPALAEDLSAP